MNVYRNEARAEAYFLQGIQFAEEVHALHLGYTHRMLMDLALLSEKKNLMAQAVAYYKRVRALTKRKSKMNKEAKARMKVIRKAMRKQEG